MAKKILIYINDLLIPSQSLKDQLGTLDQVLSKLEAANLTVNLKKCKFLTQTTTFLGFIVAPEGVTKDPSYVETIKQLPRPTNLKSFQRLLGLLYSCSGNIFNYAEKVALLYELMKKGIQWKWRKEHTE